MNIVRNLTGLCAVVLWSVLVVGCSTQEPARAQAPTLKIGDKAPDFTLKDADGKSVRLSDYRGKVVLLDFWATWCGPCKIEIPWFIEMQRENKDRGFEVLGVSMDEEGWEVVKPFLSQMKVNYRVVIGNDDVGRSFDGVEALPTTFLIDRDGNISAKHVGVTSRKDIDDGIQKLLQAPVPAAAGRSPGGVVPALAVRAK